MYDAASTLFQQKLSQVSGVGQVFVGGGSLPAVRVSVNPSALTRYGIGLEEVRNLLTQTNVNRPKGQLADQTMGWEIEANDQLHSAAEYRPLIVSYRGGAGVRLMDVAGVEDSVEDLHAGGLVNGEPAVMVVVFRQPDANIIGTVDRVRSVLPQLESSMPGDVKLSVVMDRTPPIRGSLRDVGRTLVISATLVILVVFAFLRNARATLIPAVAIGVSLIGAFGVMFLLDYNLDNLSLMALTIATGFVVDDAIVVLENITRYIERGDPPREAALAGSREIAFTVLSMSASLIAVFIPILLMSGMVGRLFREFAVTLSIAVAVSLVISLTTTPMMCSTLLRSEKGKVRGPLYRASESAFEAMRSLYERSLGWALGHPAVMLILMLLTIGVTVVLFFLIPKGFFPEQDTGRLSGTIMAEQDISSEAMRGKLAEISEIIRSDPDVESVSGFFGGGGGGGATANTARMFIALQPFESRKASGWEVMARLRPRLAGVIGAPTFLQPVQDLRVGGRPGSALYQYTLRGDNLAELNRWAVRMLQKMRAQEQLVDVSSDQQDKGLRVNVEMDRTTGSRLGITPQMVDETLYNAFGQRQVAVSYTLLNQYHVILEVQEQFRETPESLKEIYIRAASGAMVPLAAFARFERGATSLAVNHQGQFPAVTLSFNLRPGVSLGEAVEVIETAGREIGMPAAIHGTFQGAAQAFQASMADQPLLILAALLAVYIVLGMLYESTIHPITILSTLPSAGVGALLALLFFGVELSVIALIGIILLIGIVKKNGIMIVDFALDAERREGKSPLDAITEASLLRFRPIMMTTLAALCGGLPLALDQGIGWEIRRPLGIAIIGGLIVSQMLTLYSTPVIYLYMDRLGHRWGGGWKGRGGLRLLVMAGLMAGVALFLGSCTVGPTYRRPEAQVPPAYKEVEGWKVAEPGDQIIRGAWWEIFDDPLLNRLEEQVNISNQNLALAEAQLRQARSLVQVARAGYFPAITVGSGYTRSLGAFGSRGVSQGVGTGSLTGLPGSTGQGVSASGESISIYSLPASLSWELDLWGRVRRTVEANQAGAEASEADLEATRLLVQAELAQSCFQLRMLDSQKELLDRTVAAFQNSLRMTKNRYAAGVASRGEVLQAETQLRSTEVQGIDIGVQRAQTEHAIALLLGKPPHGFSIPFSPLSIVPPAIPVGVPSELLERRPDIASAERRMATANAQIGVAKAAFYPTISLNALAGFESTALSRLLQWSSRFWSIGGSLSETVFEGGLRRAQTEQALAAYDATVASYRQSVLTAFQEVEDNLAALRILEEEAGVQEEAVRASKRSVNVITNQYNQGTVSYLDVNVAQTAALGNQRTAIDILGRRLSACVLLIKAMGGGWKGK